MPKIYNVKHKNAPHGAVYIGRPGKWGNPFIIGKDGSREEVIDKYRAALISDKLEYTIEDVKTELKGKDLVCFCFPESCHGDVLLEIANNEI